ncbi:MAG: hypothetical protein M3270_00285 [Thermoproteota archaeon]|nr:hypothetical protein [Thermoproteota archaeon]
MSLLDMDGRVKESVLAKIDETISSIDEVLKIQETLWDIPVRSSDDFLFGIALGRIYNSFHYQTRRALKRNATKEEFEEFVAVLATRADEIRNALKQQYRNQGREQ